MDKTIISSPRLNSPDAIANINATIPEGHTAEIIIKKNRVKPSFYMVGNGRVNSKLNKRIQPMNFWREAMTMTAQEQWLMLQIENNLIPEQVYDDKNKSFSLITTCKVNLPSKDFTSSEKQRLHTAYKRLREKDIIRRVKREHYMINPSFLIPTDFDSELELYNSLK